MSTTIQRLVSSSFVFVVAVAGLAISTPAQAQYRQQRSASQQRYAEGSQMWGQDGWCYVVRGGRWVRTSYFRRYPDARHYPQVYDIYQNGRFAQRVGASAPRTTAPAATPQLRNAEIQLQQVVNQLNQLKRAGAGGLIAGSPGTIGGFSSSSSSLPGTPVYVGGARTNGEVIFGLTGGNWRSPFLDPNCTASYRGC